MSEGRLRPWGGTFATGLAFPVAALVAAVLVFTTSPVELGLVVALIAALVPWALVAGDVRVGPWVMVLAGVGIPSAVVIAYDAPGAIFLPLLAVAWLSAGGESLAAELTALVGGAIVVPLVFALGDWPGEREAFVFFATGGLITWCIGRILRRERQLVAALTEAHDRLEAAAGAAERQRIARDVHDVVGHSLTVMLLNVVGARRVLRQDPAAAAEALDRAEQAGRGSLQSVRAIVGLLRAPGEPEGAQEAGAPPPNPTAADIVELVETSRAAGLRVQADVAADIEAVDPYTGLAAYRVVQEALTNAERHAPGAEVLVRVRLVEGDRLAVSVRNGPSPSAAPPPPGGAEGGTGLDGMRQRVGTVGGAVTAGPTSEGTGGAGWAVEASIPVARADTAADAAAGTEADAAADAAVGAETDAAADASADDRPKVRR